MEVELGFDEELAAHAGVMLQYIGAREGSTGNEGVPDEEPAKKGGGKKKRGRKKGGTKKNGVVIKNK